MCKLYDITSEKCSGKWWTIKLCSVREAEGKCTGRPEVITVREQDLPGCLACISTKKLRMEGLVKVHKEFEELYCLETQGSPTGTPTESEKRLLTETQNILEWWSKMEDKNHRESLEQFPDAADLDEESLLELFEEAYREQYG